MSPLGSPPWHEVAAGSGFAGPVGFGNSTEVGLANGRFQVDFRFGPRAV